MQIIHIWDDILGDNANYYDSYSGTSRAYMRITKALCREYGLLHLPGASGYPNRDFRVELMNFLLDERDAEKVLDTIQLSFQVIDSVTRDYNYLKRRDADKQAERAIDELNARFKEHGIGFQYVDGDIIRIDSELIHDQVVKPALTLLHEPEYAGAQAEFLKAHKHYRDGNAKEALTECLKALESTMKAICDKRRWKYDPNSSCSKLIQTCIDNGLIPELWIQHFSALRSVLESGVPPARNKLGSHGQGSTVVDVPQHIVAYVLHMTAAGIVFLVQAERSNP